MTELPVDPDHLNPPGWIRSAAAKCLGAGIGEKPIIWLTGDWSKSQEGGSP
jgi:hypothetical protein